MGMLWELFYTQYFLRPFLPDTNFNGQTIIVTGSNVGIGKEACKHFVKLNASRVIATVRTKSRGQAALEEIEKETGRKGVVELWELDYGSYASVLAFGERAKNELTRLDKVVLNAGLATRTWELFEGHESTILVNVISTALLSCLLLPVLRRSAELNGGCEPVLSVVGSGVHAYAQFNERHADRLFEALDNPKASTMSDRYTTSKLLQLFVVREIAERTSDAQTFVTVNTVSPGLCSTELARDVEGPDKRWLDFIRFLFGWTAEQGARTLVHASAAAGEESHGAFISNCLVENNFMSPYVTSLEGVVMQKKIWDELEDILESIQPGVSAELK